MHYLKIPGADGPISVFDICQAHAQLESDYNDGGILWERPSNQRRNESTGCQLQRLGYSPGMRWVDICAPQEEDGDPYDDNVRWIYLRNVLKWNLPADEEMKAAINRTFVREWLEKNHPGYLI